MTFKPRWPPRLNSTGGPIVGRATVNPAAASGNAFAFHMVDVEVDPETGKVDILRYTALQDVQARRSTRATWRGRCRVEPCRASAGR